MSDFKNGIPTKIVIPIAIIGMVAAFVIAFFLGGKFYDYEKEIVPDVTNVKLYDALTKVQEAGFPLRSVTVEDGEGGIIVDKDRNAGWTVCSQLPTAGEKSSRGKGIIIVASDGDC